MAKLSKFAVLFVGIALFSYSLHAQGYDIKIKIPALKDSTVLLGHHFASLLYPDDTVKLDKKGMGSFKRTKKLPGGMYFVFLPTKKYFDILIGDNQSFTITADTTDFLKTTKFTGSPNNQLFYEYQNLLTDNRAKADKLIERKKKSTSAQQKDSITKAIDKINQEVMGNTRKWLSDNPSLFFTTFLKSLQDVDIPDFPRDAKGNILDSAFQWRYFKTHYFDNFNYADNRLLRTPVYEQKIKYFIEKVIPQTPDSINKELDIILDKVKGNEEVFRYLLVTFFKQYANSQVMGQDAVFVHLSEKYYIPSATWASKDDLEKLKKEVAKKKPNLIGQTAPNLSLVEVSPDHFMIAKTDTALKSNPYVGNPLNLKDIQAKFLVVAFWEADCGHCKKAIPALHEVYQRIKNKGAKVLAIHMISSVEGKRKWIDFVNENNMYDWINAWSPYNHDYKDSYDVYSTPVIYVLDENKTIVAKRIGAEQVEEVIDFELKKAAKTKK
ncbi:MAG: DUF5106 domain-containing protein [Bacteroidota bacterium]|nr:DUF5106 domain-containing protein [Bacteroidota bacterium]